MTKYIDLSLPISDQMPGVKLAEAKTLERDGWNATTLSLYSHCGTHMDAPRHFLPGGRTLDQQDLSVCFGPATVINLAPAEPRQRIDVASLGHLAEEIRPGARLLFRTDWYKRYGTPAYRDELPRLSLDLAQWLVQRKVAMVGVEPPSVADVNNPTELTEVHQTLFRGNIVIVEGLANLDQIRTPVVQFVALPLRIVGGDGSPVRAVAIESET
ncbi:cyclase family protein [Roseiconus nitratireducens]|uniref:Cyclase family protein n=1 Tax=Roseiconus nitratireducens TaxID=2605748 RepID=A0A5M6D5B0_9BACT|nr:cyclase family protein [Roseiconus nitratireducens]KAA5541760.1 cyclase family protein [Roseiconus nitratireducens]